MRSLLKGSSSSGNLYSLVDLPCLPRNQQRRRLMLLPLVVLFFCLSFASFLSPPFRAGMLDLLPFHWFAYNSDHSCYGSACSCCYSTDRICPGVKCGRLLLPPQLQRNISCRIAFSNAANVSGYGRSGGGSGSGAGHDGDSSSGRTSSSGGGKTKQAGFGYQRDDSYLHIPVIGVPLVSDPKLYLMRWLYSIDLPAAHIVIVTGGEGRLVQEQLEHIKEHSANVTVIQCDDFVAVTQGWNLILSTFFDEAPWSVVSAHDVQFTPGALAKLAVNFQRDLDKGIDFAHIAWDNEHDMHHGRWNVWAISRRAIMRLGFFDENIVPSFYEDDEFEIRMRKAKPPVNVTHYADVLAVHGKRNDASFTSGTSRIPEEVVQRRIMRGKMMNSRYVASKWGCYPLQGPDQWGWYNFDRNGCSNRVPYNRSSGHLWQWSVDLERRHYINTAVWKSAEGGGG